MYGMHSMEDPLLQCKAVMIAQSIAPTGPVQERGFQGPKRKKVVIMVYWVANCLLFSLLPTLVSVLFSRLSSIWLLILPNHRFAQVATAIVTVAAGVHLVLY